MSDAPLQVMMPLPSSKFSVVAVEDYRFSWGVADVHIQRRNG